MPKPYAWLSLWGRPLAPTSPPDRREVSPPFLCNHTTAYPVTMTLEEAAALRVLFDVELDALAATGGACRVAQVRHSKGGNN